MMELQNVEDLYPLSPTQHGMLFHSLYEQGGGAYLQQVVYTLSGPLDAAALRRAWQRTVERHPILRSAFLWDGLDEPVQVVRQQVELPWRTLDWSGDPAPRQRAALDHLCAEQRARGLDLDDSPLMNCTLIRTAADRHWFVWNHHHIILDAWSIALVMGDVFSLYASFSRGLDAEPAAPPPYRDYIAWLQAQDLGAAAAFWREALRGFAAPTPLPEARGNPAAAPGPLGTAALALSAEQTAGLRAFAQAQRVTLNTLVQGAWALLLGRHADSRDVVFGATTAGRPAEIPGIEAMVGLFINTLPVRVALPDDQSLAAWLQGLQKQHAERDRYAHSPLVEIQGWSDVPRGSPLFESLLVFENAPANSAAEVAQGGLAIGDIEYSGRTNYPLTIGAVPGNELFFEIQYDTERFEQAAIERILRRLEAILAAMAADPGQRLGALAWLPRDEYARVTAGFNPSPAAPGARTWPELFAEQAARNPDQPALVAGPATLTYAQLDERANALGRRLRELGAGPERLVGLYLGRSADLVVGLLAALKAGAAAVPLDPSAPATRLAGILGQLAAPLVLTSRALAPGLPAGAAQPIILEDLDLAGDHGPLPASDRASLAYVIFTSGSTGAPKGVAVPHGALADHCLAAADHYAYGAADRVLQFAVLHFDAALEQLLVPLINGATVVLRGDELWDPAACAAAIDEFGLSVINLPTAYWHQLTGAWAAGGRPRAQHLRLVIVGGEALAAEPVARWRAMFGDAVRLLNAYGPTEAVITATTCEALDETADILPIGRPFGPRSAYILDRAGRPLPIGGVGELYLGGAALARGYLGQPALTAARFVPDPFSSQPGARLYRTGDLARFLADGRIAYVGRADHQVKIRGFRVELGEIEAALERHPAVRASAVILREGRLIGYVVPADPAAAEGLPGDLRDFLKEHLPDYMLPAAIVALEALPLTSSGKLDRGALAAALPAPERDQAQAPFVAPRTFVERELAALWMELLRVDAVGVHDNFFALGGHSLLMMQLASRIREKFEVTVALRALFDAPTVVDMSKLIAQHLIEEEDPEALDEMLDELQNLSPDELLALLQAEGEQA